MNGIGGSSMEHRTFWTISLIVLIKLYMVIIVYLNMPMYFAFNVHFITRELLYFWK